MRTLQRTSSQLFTGKAAHRIGKTCVLFAQIEIHAFPSSVSDVDSGQLFAMTGVKLRAMPCAIVMAVRFKRSCKNQALRKTAGKQHRINSACC